MYGILYGPKELPVLCWGFLLRTLNLKTLNPKPQTLNSHSYSILYTKALF